MARCAAVSYTRPYTHPTISEWWVRRLLRRDRPVSYSVWKHPNLSDGSVSTIVEGAKMKVLEETKNGVVVCKIEGEVNIGSSPDLRKVFDAFIQKNIQKIVLDFSAVSYIDSSGLATLIELLQRLKKINGKFRISNMSEKIKNVFEITKLHKIFETFDTQELALKDF
jgi:anti-sigma B factor antagonist